MMDAMPTFIAFLRAVNVGKRKYPMAELRQALTDAGFEEVETHIQTGNVLFRTSLRSRTKVVTALEKAMLEDRGFEVPVVLLTPAELTEVYDEAAAFAKGRELKGHYLSLLATPPDAEGSEGSRGPIGRGGGGPGRHASGAPDADHEALPRGDHQQCRGGEETRGRHHP